MLGIFKYFLDDVLRVFVHLEGNQMFFEAILTEMVVLEHEGISLHDS